MMMKRKKNYLEPQSIYNQLNGLQAYWQELVELVVENLPPVLVPVLTPLEMEVQKR